MVNNRLVKKLPMLIGVCALVGIGVLIFYMANHFADDDKPAKKMVQQITLIAPPPPPPPPEIEPEIEEEQTEAEVPEELVDEAMPDEAGDSAGEELGIDADGAAGSDGFGLVGRKGGRGLLGGGNAYTATLQEVITELLIDDRKLKYMEYLAIIRLWVNQEGKLSSFEIDERSGNDEALKLLNVALARVDKLDKAPPLEMPQPIKLRVQSRL